MKMVKSKQPAVNRQQPVVKSQEQKGFQSIEELLLAYDFDKNKYISREFQDYGYRLAVELGEEKSISLYIKLAKQEERPMLEKARVFVKDARNVRSKGKLFMWALNKLKKGEPLSEEEGKVKKE